MVFDGIAYYVMVFDGTHWYCMVLNVTLWYSMILDAIAWYSMKLIDVPKKYPKVPMSTPPKKVPKSTQKYQKSQKVPTRT